MPVKPWSLFSRSAAGVNTGGVRIVEADCVLRRITTGTFALEVPWSPDVERRFQKGSGVILRRDGQTICSGMLRRRGWRQGASTDEFPAGVLSLEGVTDDVIGELRLVAPNPALALSAQQYVGAPDVWSMTAPIETIMHAIVNLNAGPGAVAARRVPGLVMGANLGRGPSVAWKSLRYPTVQEELRRLAARAEQAGVRLLPVFEQTELGLTFHVRSADDRTGLVVFGAALGNLDEQEYAEDGDDGVREAVAGGKGEGGQRIQRSAVQTDAETLAWGVLREVYVDRRETADVDDLQEAADDAIADGVAGVQFRSRAMDTIGTRWGVDFDLNSLATVRVGPAGFEPILTFEDLVREVHFRLDPKDRTDEVTAAVGHEGASTGVELPSLKRLRALRTAVTRLQRSP